MRNFEVAKILRAIAAFEEMKGEKFKPQAYERAAYSIETLNEELNDIYEKGGTKALLEIPGVGKNIAEKIEEALKTGKISYYEQLKKKIPVDFESLTSIEGVGPKTVLTLYKKLKIKSVEDLEKAAKSGKIEKLEHFGKKSEQKILQSIEFFKRGKGRLLLGYALPLAKEIEERLKKLPEVEVVVLSGSARRMKETVGDFDFLVVSKKPAKIMDYFVSMPEVVNVIGKGETKTTVRLKMGIDADVRVVPPKSFGGALQYFTGNKDHNIELRRIAISKGWKLSEYGIFDKNDKQIPAFTEKEIYEKLGLKWIPPELRENTGEINAARKNKLPNLIEYGSLKGDLQVQTNWADGSNSIEEMVEEAKRMGLEYVLITDHTKFLAMTGGLDEKKILEQKKEIEKINKNISGFRILSGAEVNIMKDGSLDINDKTLAQLDVVGAAVHSYFKLTKEEQTKRLVATMENENIDIIFHLTGREIQKREPIDVDIEKILQTAKDTGTVLEIDSYPDRLDMKDEHIKKAVETRCKLSIDSDAHNKSHFKFLELGIAQARRGWAEAKDVINTFPAEKMLKFIKH